MPKGKGKKVAQNAMPGWTKLTSVRISGSTREIRRVSLFTAGVLTPGTSGVFAAGPVIQASGVTAATEWASYSARYTEARVLAIRVTFLPRYPVGYVSSATGISAFALGQVVIAPDRSAGAGPLTSMNQALAMAGKLYPTHKTIVFEMKATDLEDQNFTSTGGMANTFRILTGVQNLATAASVAHYDQVTEWMVEFQSPQ